MALLKPHEVLKTGRRRTARGWAGLIPAVGYDTATHSFFRGMADILSLCSNRTAAREVQDYGLEAIISPKAKPPHAPAASLQS